jgi:hypothetical protein
MTSLGRKSIVGSPPITVGEDIDIRKIVAVELLDLRRVASINPKVKIVADPSPQGIKLYPNTLGEVGEGEC